MTLTSAPMLTVATLLLGTRLVPPWGSVFILVNYLQHANIGLRFGFLNYFFALPEVHRYHHSTDPRYYNTNYAGGFTLWDHVFGTFHYDPENPAVEFGLSEEIPMQWHRQQIEPLVWIARDIRRSRPLRRLFGDPKTAASEPDGARVE